MDSEIRTPPVEDSDDSGRVVAMDDDVLTEILRWLPAKSVIRCKSVCKHWLSLISAPQFCQLHTLRHHEPPQPSLILRAHNSHFFYFHPILNRHKLIPYSFSVPNPKILSSCNGLMLLQSDPPQSNYYVYNPTTKQSRQITLTNSNNSIDMMGLTLAFDPTKSPHYKIVCVRATTESPSDDDERCCQIEVYDSVSRSWQLCLERFTAPVEADFSCGVRWNNGIHWGNFSRPLLYFDMDTNAIGDLPRPAEGDAAFLFQLQESNGHLYRFIILLQHLDAQSLAVYELQEDYSQWLLKYHDAFDQVASRICILRNVRTAEGGGALTIVYRILSFMKGDDEETCTLVGHVPGKIIAYRFLDGSCEEFVDLTNQPFYREDSVQFDCKDVYQFGESLAPV